MRTYKMGRYESQLLEMMQTAATVVKIQSMNLGGIASVSGGGGGPPGGFTGYLPQNRVAYDSGEIGLNTVPASGYPSLYDNLNHIRYRLTQIEDFGVPSSGIAVLQNGTTVAGGVNYLNFVGASATNDGGGQVTVTISGGGGGGHVIKDEGNLRTQRTYMNFTGTGVTVVDIGGTDTTEVQIPAGVSDHTALSNLNSTSYYHLTQANHTDLTDSGDSALHYHATDRNRENHTGIQTAATISGYPNDSSKYLNGVGGWVTISGGPGGGIEEAPIDGSAYSRKDAGWVVASAGSGHTIQDEGVSRTQRTKLNFIGDGVTVTDNSGADSTDVTIVSSGAPSSNEYASSQDITISIDGTLAVASGIGNYVSAQYATISGIYLYSYTLGSAGSTTIDIHKNGTTIFGSPGDRPELAYNDGDKTASNLVTVVSLIPGDIISWDIDTVATDMIGLAITTHLINAVVSGISVNYGPGNTYTYNTYNGDATPMVSSAAQIYAYGLFR
jgi:hypothetical protein